MEITITLRDTEDGAVELEEKRLPYAGETNESVTTATMLAGELRKMVADLEEVKLTACGIPYFDDEETDWEEH